MLKCWARCQTAWNYWYIYMCVCVYIYIYIYIYIKVCHNKYIKLIITWSEGELVTSYVRFQVFKVVAMKHAIFWNVTRCGFYKNRHFGGTYRLHHQGEMNQRASISVINYRKKEKVFWIKISFMFKFLWIFHILTLYWKAVSQHI
jgi:hypothetical protein